SAAAAGAIVSGGGLLSPAAAPPLAGAEGVSLVPLVRGGRTGPASAYGETYFPLLFMNWAPLRSIQDDRWKFVDAPVQELYDLVNDPREGINLAGREPARAAAMRRALGAVARGGRGARGRWGLRPPSSANGPEP